MAQYGELVVRYSFFYARQCYPVDGYALYEFLD